MNNQDTSEQFNEQALLKGLNTNQVETLKKTFVEQQFEPNQVIIEEGDLTQDIYLLVEGEVGVLKWDDKHFSQTLLGKIGKGEMFGEMSFLDRSPRSSTVKALKKTKILKIDPDSVAHDPEIFSKMAINIATANINRLRNINRQFVKNLETKEKQSQIQENSGQFLLLQYLILGLSVFIAGVYPFPHQAYLPWLIALFPSLFLLKIYKFPLHLLKINVKNIFNTIIQTFLFISLFLVFIYLLNKYSQSSNFLQTSFSLHPQLPIINWEWLTFLAFYTFAQEFIGRVILQNSLQKILKSTGWAILLNGCFLFLFFLPLGLKISSMIFLINLPMGCFFNIEKNLMSLFLIHYILLLCHLLAL